MDEIKSLEVELQGMEEILYLDNRGGHVTKASDIKQILFDLRVVIPCLMEQTKKEPTPHVFGKPIMGGVNLPHVEMLTFDSNI